jgi:pimeloyl-ACP methyl ester carboxylesterase
VGWGTNDPSQTVALQQIQNYWYQWYMSTPRGEAWVRENRRKLTEYIWDTWCPFWKVDPQEFDATARAFDNSDWSSVVLHSYRHRWGWADGDPRYADLERRLANPPKISVPTLVLHGADDPCNAPFTSENKEGFFSGPYRRVVVWRCGHFPQRERPQLVLDEVIPALRGV